MTSTDMWDTTLAAAQANVLASSQAQAAHLNDNLKTLYLSRFNDWTISVMAGKIDNSNPPQPPKGYIVVTGPEGFAFPEFGNDPVCAMPPIPATVPPYVPPVLPEPDHVRNVPPGDTMPVGFTMIAPDGSKWQKQSSPTPFGVAYFYAKVG